MLTDMFTDTNNEHNEIELPEDSSVWSQIISEAMFTAHPELSKHPSTLTIDKFNPIKLYAKGSYKFDVAGTQVVFPVIIKSKKLQPFDIMLVDDTWFPATAKKIEELELSAELGSDTENTSGFYTATAPLGGTRVPYETVAPMGLGGVEYADGGKYITASVSKISKLAKRLQTDKALVQTLYNNKAAKLAFERTLMNNTYTIKSAAIVRDGSDAHIYIKEANGDITVGTKPVSEVKMLVRKIAGAGAYLDFVKTGFACSPMQHPHFIAKHMLDSATDNMLDLHSILPKILETITNTNMPMHSMFGDDPIKPRHGIIIKIKKVEKLPGMGMGLGALMNGGLFKMLDGAMLGTNPEAHADHEAIETERVDVDDLKHDDTVLPILSASEAVEPIQIDKVLDMPMAKVIIGKGKESGNAFTGLIMKRLDTKLAEDISQLTKVIPNKGRMTLPANTIFVKVAYAKNIITSKGEYKNKLMAAVKQASREPIELRYNGNTEFFINKERYLGEAHVKAALAMQDLPVQAAEDFIKEAKANKKVVIYIADKEKVPTSIIKKIANAADWVKIASVMHDTEESVNSVLGLGLLDDGASLDKEEATKLVTNTLSKLAKLIAQNRLGQETIPESEAVNAINALQEVLESLKM